MKQRGFAIILVLATLVLLAMLSLTYIKLALIDRNIARNYMDNKRAKLIAQSGVDYAIARVQEDLAVTGWQNLATKSININGANTNYTESSGSTYGQDRDIFKVEARDSNSMINVNDGLANDRVKENTKRILNVLGDIVGIATLGDKIINNRPPQGYTSRQELLKYLTQTEFNTVKDLITTHAWQDPDVANPVPLSSRYRSGLVYATDPAVAGSFDHAFYGTDELNAQWIEIVSRSPVNINQADERVLIALIQDLKGIFCSDRRRNVPTNISTALSLNYNPASTVKSSQLGFLYATEAITNAQTIAAEIKKCRENDPSYAGKWFRGPFKTWRQFNAFVDDLVPRTTTDDSDPSKIIKDSRSSIFLEYNSSDNLDSSDIALRIAHQAKGDVLKANFNPNLHLNELNPDANIKTHVDKTDLIVNSTEFCFTPMGIFEIESEGFILKAVGTDNTIIANSKLQAIVKLYDAYRETNQRQFLAGEIPNTATNTNNGRTLEILPEPSQILDVGGNPIARDNEYSGYISLPTVRRAVTSPLYCNFTSNFNASNGTVNTGAVYSYNTTNRLVRSYRGTISPIKYAPANFRTDGAYLERSRGLTYSVSVPAYYYVSFCYWVKPWFYPEQTGKPRAYLNMTSEYSTTTSSWSKQLSYSKTLSDKGAEESFSEDGTMCPSSYHIKKWYIYDVIIKKEVGYRQWNGGTGLYANYYFPAQGNETPSPYLMNSLALCIGGYYTSSTSSSSTTDYDWTYVYTYYSDGCYNTKTYYDTTTTTYYNNYYYKLGFRGKMTDVLNHNYHGDSKPTYFKSGQWVHIAGRRDSNGDSTLVINGTLSTTSTIGLLSSVTPVNPTTLYMGESGLDPARNWSSDSTIDELYYGFYSSVFPDTSLDSATGIYFDSRYFRTGTDQSSFISQEINLSQPQQDMLAPSDTKISSPGGATGSSATLPSTSKLRILGVSWTWYAEDTDAGNAILKNHKNPSAATYIYPVVKVKFIIDGSEQPQKYDDDGLSNVDLDVTGSTTIKYKVILELPDIPLDAVLLYSPVFDDITIYYTSPVRYVTFTYFE